MMNSSSATSLSPASVSNVSTSIGLSSHDDLRHLNFTLRIAQKPDEKNFHLWHQHVELYINAYNLMEFVVCSRIPPNFLMTVLTIHVKSILHNQFGSWKIKCCCHGLNPHFWAKSFLVFLAALTLINCGIVCSVTFKNKRVQELINCVRLRWIIPQCKIIFSRSVPLLMPLLR